MNRRESVEKVRELIDGIRIAMLTTVGEDGHLYSRPMASLSERFHGSAWFFSSDDSPKAHDVLHNRNVNLAYSNVPANKFVSLSGIAEIVHDKEKMKTLWTPALQAWFPDGLEDPHLALIKIKVETAEYWAGPSKTVHYFEMARALLTGDEYEAGENGKLDLKRTA